MTPVGRMSGIDPSIFRQRVNLVFIYQCILNYMKINYRVLASVLPFISEIATLPKETLSNKPIAEIIFFIN